MLPDYDIYALVPDGVTRLEDGAFIPEYAHNRDWKEYQAWLADGHTPRSLSPGSTYVWDGSQWVEDEALAEAEHNAPLIDELALTDAESVRPIRALLLELAKVYPPEAGKSERAYLLENELRAMHTREEVLPPNIPTLEEAKAQRIFELRIQLLAYTRLGFIWDNIRWSSSVTDMMLYITLAGYLTSGNLMTPDSKLHVWDASYTEHTLTTQEASRLSGALYQWLYVAQGEAQAKVAEVQACTTVEEVQAVTWTWTYSKESPFNAGMPVSNSGFDKGFDKGYG